MELATVILIIAALVLIMIVAWYISTMNTFARLAVKITESDSDIDVALTKRFDTLTKMLDTVKGYAEHEVETLSKVVQMRQGMSMSERSEASNRMDDVFSRVNVLAESYPQLRASENFKVLQDAITDTEEHLQAARRIYNMNVSRYNQMLVSWPANIVGRQHGHTPHVFFEAEQRKKQDVDLKF